MDFDLGVELWWGEGDREWAEGWKKGEEEGWKRKGRKASGEMWSTGGGERKYAEELISAKPFMLMG